MFWGGTSLTACSPISRSSPEDFAQNPSLAKRLPDVPRTSRSKSGLTPPAEIQPSRQEPVKSALKVSNGHPSIRKTLQSDTLLITASASPQDLPQEPNKDLLRRRYLPGPSPPSSIPLITSSYCAAPQYPGSCPSSQCHVGSPSYAPSQSPCGSPPPNQLPLTACSRAELLPGPSPAGARLQRRL